MYNNVGVDIFDKNSVHNIEFLEIIGNKFKEESKKENPFLLL